MTNNTSQEGTPGLPKQLLLIPDTLGTNRKGKTDPQSLQMLLPAAHAEVSIFQHCIVRRTALGYAFGDGRWSTVHAQTRSRDPWPPFGSRVKLLAAPAKGSSSSRSSLACRGPFKTDWTSWALISHDVGSLLGKGSFSIYSSVEKLKCFSSQCKETLAKTFQVFR